ncbi:MAG: SIS domain-containing protein [Propioniciclava sp.]
MSTARHQTMLAAAREVVRAEADAVAEVANQLDDTFVEVADLLAQVAGKVFVVGSGTSGAMARRMAHLFSVSGTPSVFVHPMDALHGTSGAFRDSDALICISRGGETAELNQLSALAQKRGMPVIALTAEPESTLGKMADITVVNSTAEGADPGGVIAMGSTLVTAVWGDAMATVLMRRSGYGWDQVLETHPAGAVGLITEAPDPLERLTDDS